MFAEVILKNLTPKKRTFKLLKIAFAYTLMSVLTFKAGFSVYFYLRFY